MASLKTKYTVVACDLFSDPICASRCASARGTNNHFSAEALKCRKGVVISMKLDKCERICAFCENASALYDDTVMLCRKKGVVDSRHRCRSFSYDPLKRRVRLKNEAPALEYIDIESI